MNFDWLRFLEQRGIDHVLGPSVNVRRGSVGIDCPFCPNDTKKHYSIELESGRIRGCWRDDTHWRSPVQLLSRLAGVDAARAHEMIHKNDVRSGTTAGALLADLQASKPSTSRRRVEMPREFRLFDLNKSEDDVRFRMYLGQRGYHFVDGLSERYGIRWCDDGPFSGRIIFPVVKDGTLLGWTARSVGQSRAKYLAHPPGDAMAEMVWAPNESDAVHDLFVVVEGTFDALAVLESHERTAAAAVLSNRAGPGRLDWLIRLGSKARGTLIMLDEGAEAQALRLSRDLACLKPRVELVSSGDPGDLPRDELRERLDKFAAVVDRDVRRRV